MRFLVDNAVSPLVAARLVAEGHEAVHVRDIGLADAPDAAVFSEAQKRGCVLVSADTDFGTLLALGQDSRPSLVLFRGDVTRDPVKQAEVLVRHLQVIHTDLQAGSVIVFDGRRIRVRRLPL